MFRVLLLLMLSSAVYSNDYDVSGKAVGSTLTIGGRSYKVECVDGIKYLHYTNRWNKVLAVTPYISKETLQPYRC